MSMVLSHFGRHDRCGNVLRIQSVTIPIHPMCVVMLYYIGVVEDSSQTTSLQKRSCYVFPPTRTWQSLINFNS